MEKQGLKLEYSEHPTDLRNLWLPPNPLITPAFIPTLVLDWNQPFWEYEGKKK